MTIMLDKSTFVAIGWKCCLCDEFLDETTGSAYEEGWLHENKDWYCPDCRAVLSNT